MTLANARLDAADAETSERTAWPVDAVWAPPLLRAAEWAKQRRRQRYVAAVKRRLRHYTPSTG